MPRAVAVTATTLAGVLLLAAPALAHVTVHSTDASQGGYAEITFRVPTEKDVPTTKIEVAMPADTPLAYVGVQPHPGWTWTTTTGKPATPLSSDDGPVDSVVTGVTWTATGPGIAPGEFDDFSLSVGPLPKAASMQFKALQTYSDGSVVRWIEDTPAGGAEPENPAPVLDITAAAADGTDGATGTTGSGTGVSASAAPETTATASDSTTTSSSNRGLSVAALVVAVVAALLGLGALLRTRRAPTA